MESLIIVRVDTHAKSTLEVASYATFSVITNAQLHFVLLVPVSQYLNSVMNEQPV